MGARPRIFVAGTDTDVGKTVVAGALALRWGAHYWKPIQSGIRAGTDSDTVAGWIGAARVFPERYRLARPVSPHLAAREAGVEIALAELALPACQGPLVVEGAGGVLTPIAERLLMADLMRELGLPVILVTRDRVGAINQTLLGLEALRARRIEVAGVVLSAAAGEPAAGAGNAEAIAQFGGVPVLGRLPWLAPLNADSLAAAAGAWAATAP